MLIYQLRRDTALYVGRRTRRRFIYRLFRQHLYKRAGHMSTERLNIHQLGAATGTSVRNIREYIKEGVLDRPTGRTRAAYYTGEHVRQLAMVHYLRLEGRSLAEIRRIRKTAGLRLAMEDMKARNRDVRVFVTLGERVQLVFDPTGPWKKESNVAQLVRGLTEAYRHILAKLA